MKKAFQLIISITLLFSVVYCKLEVPLEEPEKATESTEEIMNDFTVKPFAEFPAYYQAGVLVFGIPDDAKGPGDLVNINPTIIIDDKEILFTFDQFFVSAGKVYFAVRRSFQEGENPPEQIIKYCTLENGTVKYLTKTKFPEAPVPVRYEGLEGGQYNITIGDYEGQPVSICDNGEYKETLIFVDGCIALPGGLLIHAPQGRGSARLDGLLFWPEGKRTMNHWKEPGRFWK